MSFYTGLGAGGGRRGASSGAVMRSAVAATREEQIEQLREVYKRIEGLHREEFTPAQRPVAPPPDSFDEAVIRKEYRKEKLRGVSVFARARRKQATAEADAAAMAAIMQKRADCVADRDRMQKSLDELWGRLCANDRGVVMATLSAAFEDNDAAAAPLDVDEDGAEATLLVVVPAAEAMPAKKPALTPTGRPTLKALLKKEGADWHKIAVCGCAVVTVKEAFAVAPGLRAARIVAVALSERDAYGNQKPQILLAARFERRRLQDVGWADADAVQVVNDTSTELQLRQVGVTKALTPLELSDQPQLAALLSQFDYGDLTD